MMVNPRKVAIAHAWQRERKHKVCTRQSTKRSVFSEIMVQILAHALRHKKELDATQAPALTVSLISAAITDAEKAINAKPAHYDGAQAVNFAGRLQQSFWDAVQVELSEHRAYLSINLTFPEEEPHLILGESLTRQRVYSLLSLFCHQFGRNLQQSKQ